MDFCVISPTAYLDTFCSYRNKHLVLAHLLLEDQKYLEFYQKELLRGAEIIVDNSAFEMEQRGEPMLSPTKVREAADRLTEYPDFNNKITIVLSDYPGEDWVRTYETGDWQSSIYKEHGFKTMYVPQSEPGDFSGFLKSWSMGAEHEEFDYLALSILSCPNVYQVRDNQLQRFLCRFHFMSILKDNGTLDVIKEQGKSIHMLGLLDGPNEIDLIRWAIKDDYITSWDSSAPVWYGLHGLQFDRSPTGSTKGKFELPVDFAFDDPLEEFQRAWVTNNINYIDRLSRAN